MKKLLLSAALLFASFGAMAQISTNITQFANNAVVFGTGSSGDGIPRVTVSNDSFPSTQAVTQSGTWTIQPGNTANTVAWKVDGSAVTQPVAQIASSFANVATNTTLTIKSGAGALDAVCVNSGGVTSGATVYDNTSASGAKIATLQTGAQVCLRYGLAFINGLTIITTGLTAADITVIYK